MNHFTTFNANMLGFPHIPLKEKAKIDAFLDSLEESNVSSILDKALELNKSNKGRKPYNPYKLFAACIYAFSKNTGSVRIIEESITFDLRFIYIMDNERPSYVTISKFLNNIVVKIIVMIV